MSSVSFNTSSSDERETEGGRHKQRGSALFAGRAIAKGRQPTQHSQQRMPVRHPQRQLKKPHPPLGRLASSWPSTDCSLVVSGVDISARRRAVDGKEFGSEAAHANEREDGEEEPKVGRLTHGVLGGLVLHDWGRRGQGGSVEGGGVDRRGHSVRRGQRAVCQRASEGLKVRCV